MKQLILLRHAKSSWSETALTDHERPLNKRGRTAASMVGRFLQQKEINPELILCSTATRTQETLRRIKEVTCLKSQVSLEDGLYGADAEGMIRLIKNTAPTVKSILLIGHNPGIQDLTIDLTGYDPSNLLPLVEAKVPTGAMVILEFDIDKFSALHKKTGHLRGFIRPKHELMSSTETTKSLY